MRSPFDVRVPKPKREGEATLLYPFDPRIAWVAACHHRTSSRISWDLFSSEAVRLEPLFEELLPALQGGRPAADRRRRLRFSVDLGSAQDFEASPLQLRGVVKNALVEALAVARRDRRRGRGRARGRVRGAPSRNTREPPHGRRHRHRWRCPASSRRAGRRRSGAAARDHGGAADHAVAVGRAVGAAGGSDGRRRHDPDRSGGARGRRRDPASVAAAVSSACARLQGCRTRRPTCFPARFRGFLRSTSTRSASRRWSATCAPPASPVRAIENSIVIGQKDVRSLTPEVVTGLLPAVKDMAPGVFCFNPPYGVRIGREEGDEKLLELYATMGRVMGRFTGWRAACFVANPHFVEAFGHFPTMSKPATNAGVDRRLPRLSVLRAACRPTEELSRSAGSLLPSGHGSRRTRILHRKTRDTSGPLPVPEMPAHRRVLRSAGSADRRRSVRRPGRMRPTKRSLPNSGITCFASTTR